MSPSPQCPSMGKGRQVLPPQLKVSKKGFKRCFPSLLPLSVWGNRSPGPRGQGCAGPMPLCFRGQRSKGRWSHGPGVGHKAGRLLGAALEGASPRGVGKADKGTPQRWVMKTQRLEGCCSALPSTHTPLPHGETSG